ncbi:E3 ubiquitin-protein ligase RDUF1-like [Zingiber officinale]|uniref:RING-type domain-containing protein n=1 Tax=Zingiber officinale TaxID=94328 RepID=A0A8J5HXA7_ZINOF|nr:E3 ubiquitin-protein ligase RDUF1-like [Zingiber officinale]KAG6533627.1 hypothetical protein ZIOFF_007502 [Zingiber officinale]
MDPIDSIVLHGEDEFLVQSPPNNLAQDPSAEIGGSPRPYAFVQGLRVVGLDSDSDSDGEDPVHDVASEDTNRSGDDLGPPLQCDCVRTRETASGGAEEEVAIDAFDDHGSLSGSRSSQEVDEWSDLEYDDALVTLIRIVLGRGVSEDFESDADPYFYDDLEEYTDYDRTRNTPTAKSVVDGLPVVLMSDEDVADKNTFCAVCKDEILMLDTVRRLPCLHIYHGDCILPWLGMRNTCPVCRYVLPTKDPECEN